MSEPEVKATPRSEPIEQCPSCHMMAWEAEQIYGRSPRYLCAGVVDCPNCRETVFVKRDTAPGDAELREGEERTAAQQLKADVRDILAEEQHRGSGKPSSSGSVRRREKNNSRHVVRVEQDWVGFAEAEESRSVTVEKLVVVLKGKVPKGLRARLKAEAARLGSMEGALFRGLMERHLVDLDAAFEVEYGSETVMLEILVTRQHADLWAAKKRALQEVEDGHTVSNADLMAAIMLREWM